MLTDLLERFFPRPVDSRQQVKNRLKLVLAHDRTDLPAHVIDDLRRDILEVVSRYVELDTEAMELSLENDVRSTILVANLPIRRLRMATIDPNQPIQVVDNPDLLALEESLPDEDDIPSDLPIPTQPRPIELEPVVELGEIDIPDLPDSDWPDSDRLATPDLLTSNLPNFDQPSRLAETRETMSSPLASDPLTPDPDLSDSLPPPHPSTHLPIHPPNPPHSP